MEPIELIRRALEAHGCAPRPRGDGYRSRCPAHDDHKPSLDLDRGKGGCAVLICRSAKCTAKAITAALGLTEKDLFPSPSGHFGRPTIVTEYDYRDATGKLVYQVVRKSNKDFPQRRPNDHGTWDWNLKGVTRVLYRLPELLKADASDWICVPEGEKDVDSLRRHGFNATCNSGGAGKWLHTPDRSPLHGRKVAVFRDNDEEGLKHRNDVCHDLNGKAADLRVVDLPGLAHKGDVSDWFAAGGTAGELRQIIEAAPVAQPPFEPRSAPRQTAPSSADLPPFRANGSSAVVRNLADVETTVIEWLWHSRLAVGKLNLIVGHPGESKSLLSIDIAARVSRGTPFVDTRDRENPAGDVIVLTAEDDLSDTWKPRLVAAEGDPARIHVLEAVEVYEFDERSGQTATQRRGFSLEADLERLEAVIAKTPNSRLLIIDPISCYLGSGTDAHSNADVRAVLAPLAELAARHRICVVLVHHLNKSTSQTALHRVTGSLAFTAAARTAWLVARDPTPKADPRRRVFLQLKSNLAGETEGLAYQVEAGPDGVPYLVWSAEPVSMRADEALAVTATKSKGVSVKAAETWLRDRLADGPVDHETIRQDAEKANVAERTLWRAKSNLKVRSITCGYGKAKESRWCLPEDINDCHTQSWQELDSTGSNWERPEDAEKLAENDGVQLLPPKTNSCQPANGGASGSQLPDELTSIDEPRRDEDYAEGFAGISPGDNNFDDSERAEYERGFEPESESAERDDPY